MPAQSLPSLSGLRVLIVDDEFLVAHHLQSVLEENGGTVVGPVGSIDDALKVVGSQPMDGALLDANLNGVSSAPIADALVAAKVPFVVVTGYGNLKLANAAMNAAPRIAKPLDEFALVKAVAIAFRRQAM